MQHTDCIHLPPISRTGPTWPQFVEVLSTTPLKGAPDKRLDTWNQAVRSTVSAKACVQLNSSFEWEQYVKVLLASCFNENTAKSVSAIAWAATATFEAFRERYSSELGQFWAELPARAREVVTHVSKVVNTSATNNILVHRAPSALSVGMLCSGDLGEHGYTSGGAMRSSGKRHFFEGAAWRNEVLVQMPDELQQEDSITTAFLTKLGAPAAVLTAMRTALADHKMPTDVSQLLRQVYATLEDGTDVLITPVPSVSMLSFLLSGTAPEGHYLAKHNFSVGGTQPGNAGGICASASGHMRVLHAAIPAALVPSPADVLRNIFYPKALLRRLSKRQVSFLKQDTLAWPNGHRTAYLAPRIWDLLEWITSPLVAALDYVEKNSTALHTPSFVAQISKSPSPFVALLAGHSDKETLQRCATELSNHVHGAFEKYAGGGVLTPEHSKHVDIQCEEFIAIIVSETGRTHLAAEPVTAPHTAKDQARA